MLLLKSLFLDLKLATALKKRLEAVHMLLRGLELIFVHTVPRLGSGRGALRSGAAAGAGALVAGRVTSGAAGAGAAPADIAACVRAVNSHLGNFLQNMACVGIEHLTSKSLPRALAIEL